MGDKELFEEEGQLLLETEILRAKTTLCIAKVR